MTPSHPHPRPQLHPHAPPHVPPRPGDDEDARTWLDGLAVVQGDELRTTTTTMIVDPCELLAGDPDGDGDDDAATVETAAITNERSPADDDPSATPHAREYAYLVELHTPRKPAVWLAVRPTLHAARAVAATIDPCIADAIIRELPLPCDETTLVDAVASSRLWSRDGLGVWSTIPADADPAATLPIGSFR